MKVWFDMILTFYLLHDHELTSTVSNRIIEILPTGIIDRRIPYDEYVVDPKVNEIREKAYQNQ